MSWPTRTTDAPSCSWTRFNVSITWRWTTTSSALVGSSARITLGRRAMAMAMHTRCFMPPLSSCGKRSATSGLSPTWSSSEATRADAACRDRFSSWSRMPSMICSRTRTTGLSEFIAPWATKAMAARRRRRIGSSASSSRLTPSSCTRPPSILPGGRISRIKARAIVDLPEPDSPTRPSRSFDSSPKLTPSTAFTGPRGVWYHTRKSSTRSTSAATAANSSVATMASARPLDNRPQRLRQIWHRSHLHEVVTALTDHYAAHMAS